MSHHRSVSEKRRELATIANQILHESVDVVDGIEKICNLRFDVGNPDGDVFYPFRALLSEMDRFPRGRVRDLARKDYLDKADAELKALLAESRSEIELACAAIVAQYAD
jgi:hypothetical protein